MMMIIINRRLDQTLSQSTADALCPPVATLECLLAAHQYHHLLSAAGY